MAAYPVNKERMNFFCLCRAIVDLCTDVLRDILYRRTNPNKLMATLTKSGDIKEFKRSDLMHISKVVGTGSFRDFDITVLYQIFRTLFIQDLRDALEINIDPNKIYTTVQNCSALSSRLTSEELNAISHSVTTNSYDNLRDELLWTLYGQLCKASPVHNVVHPTKPWGQNPDPGTITLGDDIERIRILRNTVHSHISTTQINDVDFREHWTLLSDVIIRMDRYLCSGYKMLLDDIKVSSLDLEAEKKYLDKIINLGEKVSDLDTSFEILTEKQEEINCDVTGLKTQVTFVTETHNKMFGVVTELKNTITKSHKELAKNISQLKKDPVPERIREKYRITLKEWQDEDKGFTETKACVNVRKAIKHNTFVTVSGNAGSGKSAIIHHIALEYISYGFDVLPVKNADDIDDYLQVDKKQLFIYDDPLGVYCMHKDKFIKWLDFKIGPSEMTKNMKVLSSVRRQIVNEPDYKNLSKTLNKMVVDIEDQSNRLSLTEKLKIIKKYIEVSKIELVVTENGKNIIENQKELFPLASVMFVSNDKLSKINDWTFSQYPFKLILEDLKKIRSHDKVKYCILILCLINKNSLNPELYSPFSTDEFTKEKAFILACEITNDDLLAGFRHGYESLLNVYLKWENGMLSFSHDLILDVIAYDFGKNNPNAILEHFPFEFISRHVIVGEFDDNEPYIIRLEKKHISGLVKRMLKELEKREFKNVFINKSWRNDSFLEAFSKQMFDEAGQFCQNVLSIFTEPQTPYEFFISELNQVFKNNKFNTWTWYFIAMFLLRFQGVTALHWIAAFGHNNLFKMIWNNLSSVQKCFVGKDIPLLHLACLGGDREIFNMVLQTESNKVNTPVIPEYDLYPIHLAVFKNEDMIKDLLKLGADINVKNPWPGRTASFYGAGCDNVKVCNIPIQHGYDSEACDRSCCSLGTNNDNKLSCKSILEFKIDQSDIYNFSPLQVAAKHNSAEVDKILLDYKNDPNWREKNGLRILYISELKNSVHVTEFLVDYKTSSNLGEKGGQIVLYKNKDSAELVKFLTDDPNTFNSNGASPLYISARNNSADVAKLLLESKADPNLCDHDGVTPLHISAVENSVDVAKLLLENKADPNFREADGRSPLLISAVNNSADVAKLLLEYKADPNLCENDGCSPLYISAINNSADVAKLLLQHGADPYLCIKDKFSAFDVAFFFGSFDVATLLMDYKYISI